jgi:DNA-binding response OmpR family regulator
LFVRLLLVEDEEGIGKFICQGLREAGHTVDWVTNGEDGLSYALATPYDVCILDIMLPNMDGFQLLRQLRQKQNQIPVLCLTARDSVEDRVRGLNLGADDYLVKPFDFSELLARIHALLRRPPLQMTDKLQVGNLEMNTVQRTVQRDGEEIVLSQREFMLLEYLMRNAGQVLTRTQIGERVWGFDFYNESNVVDVYIGYLRRKIDKKDKDSDSLIKTVRGVGFRLSAKDHE